MSALGVSVIVPHYNQPSQLRRCLAALSQQIVSVPFEVIVADDGSTAPPDASHAAILPESIKILRFDNSGPAAARNRGAERATHQVLAFTDADCLPSKDWLQSITDAFAVSPQLAGVVGPLIDITLEPKINMLHRFMRSLSYLDQVPQHFIYKQLSFIGTIGANLAVRRSWFDRLGGFDPSFRRPGGEDYDFGFRVQDSGGEIAFVSNALVQHMYPTHYAALIRRWVGYGTGKARFAEKHGIDPHHLHLVCQRWLDLILRVTSIDRAARDHFPAKLAEGAGQQMAILFVEYLFQIGAIRHYSQVRHQSGRNESQSRKLRPER